MNTPYQPYENALVIAAAKNTSSVDTAKYEEPTVLKISFNHTEDFDLNVNGFWQGTDYPIVINLPYDLPVESGDKYVTSALNSIGLVPFDNLSTCEKMCFDNNEVWEAARTELASKLSIGNTVSVSLLNGNEVNITLSLRTYKS